jgi:predicted RNA-binding Zn-ribbon protein involved in translation (DUF1610 family)
MGKCPNCSEEIQELTKSTSTEANLTLSGDISASVWECPHCEVILGTSRFEDTVLKRGEFLSLLEEMLDERFE